MCVWVCVCDDFHFYEIDFRLWHFGVAYMLRLLQTLTHPLTYHTHIRIHSMNILFFAPLHQHQHVRPFIKDGPLSYPSEL